MYSQPEEVAGRTSGSKGAWAMAARARRQAHPSNRPFAQGRSSSRGDEVAAQVDHRIRLRALEEEADLLLAAERDEGSRSDILLLVGVEVGRGRQGSPGEEGRIAGPL